MPPGYGLVLKSSEHTPFEACQTGTRCKLLTPHIDMCEKQNQTQTKKQEKKQILLP